MNEKNNILVFIAITFSLSILLSLFIGFTGGHDSKFIWLQFASMPIPAITVLIMTNLFKAPVLKEIKWNKLPVYWLVLALLLMPVTIHITCLPLIKFLNNGVFPWQTWLKAKEEGLYISPNNFGWGSLTSGELIFKIFINALTGVVIVSVLAFLEEVGWRAWMLPRLIKQFNVRKGIFIGSLIWALWHVPFMLSGILYLKAMPTYLIVLINPFGIFGAGLVISWLWTKTKSLWIVSIAHGALNNWGQYAFKYMQDSKTNLQSQQIWLSIGVNGSLLILGLLIFITMKNSSDDKTTANMSIANSRA
ncbi:MAG: CPBP family intramembrane metalloprotease [Chitinophagaceae bacterium]|nr:CPBP family intramembrane metalloprotease [Chitinophagaceae bacterium]